ncbi:helix-turn-helix domain-containing protein [Pelotomaculum terephthalicicum JT]|uniref:helix-turn-helix domain-containing protein n=1 Tax=Pelotomaculum terephthalicicum TaxID=206393 RepID=UPI001F0501E3|nr:helix-turn-helix domain-containing protein [Pelotomaculum terephthalicicum]MCG9969597.1 helix-turn-helix domain-containing protein [Pelotomaculum terephthalicicum JT]
MSCYKCDAEVVNKTIDWVSYINGIKVVTPDIPVEECPNCGEITIDSKDSETICQNNKGFYDKEFSLDIHLKEIREKLGLTQEEVAKRMGWTKQRYNAVEKNKSVPSVLLALKLANALECDVNEIYKLKVVSKRHKKILLECQ